MAERKPWVNYEPQEGKTKQSDNQDADINVIMNRWLKTGDLTFSSRPAVYGDFSSGLDFHTAMNRILAAQEAFDAQPAHVREHVDNDPGKFMDLVYDPLRHAELEKLGLTERKEEPVPAPVPPVEPEA